MIGAGRSLARSAPARFTSIRHTASIRGARRGRAGTAPSAVLRAVATGAPQRRCEPAAMARSPEAGELRRVGGERAPTGAPSAAAGRSLALSPIRVRRPSSDARLAAERPAAGARQRQRRRRRGHGHRGPQRQQQQRRRRRRRRRRGRRQRRQGANRGRRAGRGGAAARRAEGHRLRRAGRSQGERHRAFAPAPGGLPQRTPGLPRPAAAGGRARPPGRAGARGPQPSGHRAPL
jgi:hypothetical protein